MLLLRCCYLFCMLSKFTSSSFWVLRSWSHIFQVVYSLSQLVLYLIANSLTKAWCVWLIIGGIFISCKQATCRKILYPDDSIGFKCILWLFYFINLLLWSQCRNSTVLEGPPCSIFVRNASLCTCYFGHIIWAFFSIPQHLPLQDGQVHKFQWY